MRPAITICELDDAILQSPLSEQNVLNASSALLPLAAYLLLLSSPHEEYSQ